VGGGRGENGGAQLKKKSARIKNAKIFMKLNYKVILYFL